METVVHIGQDGKVPKNARLMTKDEVRDLLKRQIDEWSPSSEMWALKYGSILPSLAATASAAYINFKFRRFFKLKSYAQISTYLPTVILPTATALIADQVILNDIILQKTACPTCVQTRSVCAHTFLGVFYPSLIAPLACASFAVRYNTIVLNGSKDLVSKVYQYVQKRPSMFLMLMAANAAVACGTTYLQQDASWKLHLKAHAKHAPPTDSSELLL